MIKVSVLYPNSPGAQFDHDYYRDRHCAMVKDRLGDSCRQLSIDRGVAGGAPDAPAAFVAMAHMVFDSVEDFQSNFGPHSNEIMADVPNYTNLTPVLQISEIVSG